MSGLRCTGCGVEGRQPTIVWDRSAPADPRPIVRPVFGYHVDQPTRPALLCERCQTRWRRREVFKPGRGR